MPRGTTLRNIRIPDELWDAVLRKADDEGRNASEVIREYLARWVARPPRNATSEMNIEADNVLDLYVEYMAYDNNGDGEYDEIDNETLRWNFIDAAVELLEKLTNRKIAE
jgi:hypothetical protein